MPVTFDGDNLRVVLVSGVTAIDVEKDLYSDWKEWFKTGSNSKYPLVFDTTGGDPVSATQDVAPYFFLRNDYGWRIRPAEEDTEITITGNLYGRNASLPLLVPTVGNYTVLAKVDRSASALVITVEAAGAGARQYD